MDPETIEPVIGTGYPPEFDEACAARAKRRIGDALGPKNFGVDLVTLPPGTASSQRHWHSHQDEFVYIIEGEATLVTDAGEQTLGFGMVAGFPAGRADGRFTGSRAAWPPPLGALRPEGWISPTRLAARRGFAHSPKRPMFRPEPAGRPHHRLSTIP